FSFATSRRYPPSADTTKKSNRIFPCGLSSPAWTPRPSCALPTSLVISPCRYLRASVPATRITPRRGRSAAWQWLISRPSATKAPEMCGGGRNPGREAELQALAETFDLVLKGGTVVNQAGEGLADLGVRDGRIAAIGDIGDGVARKTVSAVGLHILPGVIDT